MICQKCNDLISKDNFEKHIFEKYDYLKFIAAINKDLTDSSKSYLNIYSNLMAIITKFDS